MALTSGPITRRARLRHRCECGAEWTYLSTQGVVRERNHLAIYAIAVQSVTEPDGEEMLGVLFKLAVPHRPCRACGRFASKRVDRLQRARVAWLWKSGLLSWVVALVLLFLPYAQERDATGPPALAGLRVELHVAAVFLTVVGLAFAVAWRVLLRRWDPNADAASRARPGEPLDDPVEAWEIAPAARRDDAPA